MKKQIFNPYLPSYEYIPDGEPRIFGDRLYVYGSHDRFNAPMFCLNDYACWSAPLSDLSDWHYEGIIYRKEQDPSNKLRLRLLFAPDVIMAPDGKYYLYYALDFKGIMSVAVCDTPAGQYQFLGHIRFPDGHIWGTKANEPFPFDPGIFVDDDNRVYLYSGFARPVPVIVTRMKKLDNDTAVVFELEADMLTIKAGPMKILPTKSKPDSPYYGHEFFEAASMRKINDKYYFIYSAKRNHELCYAISDYPDKEFKYGGTIISIGDIGLNGRESESRARNYLGNTHGGIVNLNGSWYVFYHRHTNRHSYSRQACAERLIMHDDGHFAQAEITSCGLNEGALLGEGSYCARIACNLWSSEGTRRYDMKLPKLKLRLHPYFTQDVKDGHYEDEQQYIANMRDGAVAGFKYFNLTNINKVSATVRGNASGEFLLSTEPDFNDIKARIKLSGVNRTYQTFSASFGALSGIYPLYFKFSGKGKIDFMAFELYKGWQ